MYVIGVILSAIVMRPSKPVRNHPVAFSAVDGLVRMPQTS